MTVHIGANKEDIAKIVLMPGDPNRAKLIAEKYLDNAKLINNVRGMLGFTGYYKDKRITVLSSGMGNPSMGIYSYELFNDYDVDYIIRIGTCGAYFSDINLFDLILVDKSYSESKYASNLGYTFNNIKSSDILNKHIKDYALNNNIDIKECNIHCTDTFYNENYKEFLDYKCIGVEMESFALLTNAYKFNKNASVILTVTDNLVTKKSLSSIDREVSTTKMIELALNSVLDL